MTDDGYTAAQAAAANTALRAALGLAPQRFGAQQFVGMISDEIEQLRRAGRTDEDIANVIRASTGATIATTDIARYYADPDARGR